MKSCMKAPGAEWKRKHLNICFDETIQLICSDGEIFQIQLPDTPQSDDSDVEDPSMDMSAMDTVNAILGSLSLPDYDNDGVPIDDSEDGVPIEEDDDDGVPIDDSDDGVPIDDEDDGVPIEDDSDDGVPIDDSDCVEESSGVTLDASDNPLDCSEDNGIPIDVEESVK